MQHSIIKNTKTGEFDLRTLAVCDITCALLFAKSKGDIYCRHALKLYRSKPNDQQFLDWLEEQDTWIIVNIEIKEVMPPQLNLELMHAKPGPQESLVRRKL